MRYGKKKKAQVGSFVLFGNTYTLGSSDKTFNAAKFKKQILSTEFVALLKQEKRMDTSTASD